VSTALKYLSPAHGRADPTANATRRIGILNIVC
jgi:hypothetical protein